MGPGRDLDALVAEKVMGYHWFMMSYVYVDRDELPGPHLKKKFKRELLGPHVDPETYPWELWDGRKCEVIPLHVPEYSTSIEDAWEVMLHLWERNDEYIIWPDGNGTQEGFSVVNHADGFLQWGESAPHAICLAALKVAGVELPE